MNCKLIDIPLEKREIVYVVQDSGTRAFLKMEYDKLPENSTIATKTEVLEFDKKQTISANDILIWDEFENNYLIYTDFQKDPMNFIIELCNFCENYLGAVEGSVYIEEKVYKQTGTKVNVSGNAQVNTGESNKEGSANTGTAISNYEKIEKSVKHKFSHSLPVPFEKEKAARYYKKKGFEKFDIFKRMYEFRKNHGTNYEGTCIFESDIMEERMKKISAALDIKVKIANLLDIGCDATFEKDSLNKIIKKMKIEFKCK